MKSTLFNMTAVLLGITFVSSSVVGLVNMITVDPIAQAKEAAKQAALKQVLPEFDATKNEDLVIDDLTTTVYTASNAGEVTGYAVETATMNGFGGEVRLMVGFTTEGKVYNINVLQQAETPGLGTNMTKEDNNLIRSIKGFNPSEKKLVNGQLAVRKDGGDVDALTAATISSRAYVEAVNRAWSAYKSVAGDAVPEGVSGATKQYTEGEMTPETQTEPAAQEGEKNE